mmetsp:Transcript_2766/g.8516  ORF Transcript_2766/g.8516 Transcript_2766/m.8516 type:complete len:483 (+) Transcript_2766:242-1690(+)
MALAWLPSASSNPSRSSRPRFTSSSRAAMRWSAAFSSSSRPSKPIVTLELPRRERRRPPSIEEDERRRSPRSLPAVELDRRKRRRPEPGASSMESSVEPRDESFLPASGDAAAAPSRSAARRVSFSALRPFFFDLPPKIRQDSRLSRRLSASFREEFARSRSRVMPCNCSSCARSVSEVAFAISCVPVNWRRMRPTADSVSSCTAATSDSAAPSDFEPGAKRRASGQDSAAAAGAPRQCLAIASFFAAVRTALTQSSRSSAVGAASVNVCSPASTTKQCGLPLCLPSRGRADAPRRSTAERQRSGTPPPPASKYDNAPASESRTKSRACHDADVASVRFGSFKSAPAFRTGLSASAPSDGVHDAAAMAEGCCCVAPPRAVRPYAVETPPRILRRRVGQDPRRATADGSRGSVRRRALLRARAWSNACVQIRAALGAFFARTPFWPSHSRRTRRPLPRSFARSARVTLGRLELPAGPPRRPEP